MSLEEQTREVALDFESKEGSLQFIKLTVTSLCKVLVEKGICTDDEIRSAFLDAVEEYQENDG